MKRSGNRMQISEGQAKRHRFLYRLLIRLIRRFIERRFGYTYDRVPNDGAPYVVVCNHNANLDPALLGLAFDHMYFVASDHIFRNAFLALLLNFVFAPIARRKATIAASTVIEMRRRLMAGHNVALFAEGERSYDGNTAPIHPTMGKLVKSFGATLVTYRLKGGYFTTPRWAFSHRGGKMSGELRGIYTKEALDGYSADEVHDLIQRDISEDAYAEQDQAPVAFVGDKLADGLETALYRCPACTSYGTLSSAEDSVRCTCGFETRIDRFGYFTPPAPRTFTDWYRSQRDALRSRLSSGQVLPFKDEVTLLTIDGKRDTAMAKGVLRLTGDQLSVGDDHAFLLKDIPLLGMYGRNHLVFTHQSNYYELRGAKYFNARYYLHIFDYYKGHEVRR